MNATAGPPLPGNVLLAHDWLTGMRGGEKCLDVMCELFPRAPLYTLLAFPDRVSATIAARDIRTSFLQRFPAVERRYRHYLPFYPAAIRSFRLPPCDLVLSSSHAVAKGIRPPAGALHISYIHTPMRYVWDMYDQYFGPDRTGPVERLFISMVARHLQRWDVRSNSGVHHFIANSEHVRDRVRRHYGRDATVIHPPVDVDRFPLSETDDGYFLVLSALVPYKRVDIAVDAFTRMGLPLRVIGDGPERDALERRAGATVRFDGRADDSAVVDAYRGCRALVFPGEEDFGIVPVEAMAAGKPVLAFGKGGATETVVEGRTGLLFGEQTAESLQAAVRRFGDCRFDPRAIRAHAERFRREVYRERMTAFIATAWEAWQRTHATRSHTIHSPIQEPAT